MKDEGFNMDLARRNSGLPGHGGLRDVKSEHKWARRWLRRIAPGAGAATVRLVALAYAAGLRRGKRARQIPRRRPTRVQIRLREHEIRALRAEAERSGRSISEILRSGGVPR